MAILNTVKGVQGVIDNLRRKQKAYGQAVERGLKRGGLELFAASAPLTPVEFGVLKASEFIRQEGKEMDTKITVGYTANYAIFVHENLDAAHGDTFNAKHAVEIAEGAMKARGPQQQAKFLETPLRVMQSNKRITELIKEEAAK